MSYKATAEKISEYRRQIADLREKMRAAQAAIEPEEVKDYEFRRAGGGAVKLSELFWRQGHVVRRAQYGGVVSLLHAMGGWLQRRVRPSPRSRRLRARVAR
jgi:hypothetical protein